MYDTKMFCEASIFSYSNVLDNDTANIQFHNKKYNMHKKKDYFKTHA